MKAQNNLITIHIRPLLHKDIAPLCALVAPIQSPAFSWSSEKLTRQLTMAETFVALVEEEVAAFACFLDIRVAVEIPVLATGTQFQKQKIMYRLLSQIIASHYRKRELWLEVHEANLAARNLYRTLGFEETSRRSAYYSDGAAALLCTREI